MAEQPVKRLNYFKYQFLNAEDFLAQQDYHRMMRLRHNRVLHSPGVADGLSVTVSPTDETAVVVGAGTAIDGLGQEIVLPSDLPLPLASQPSGATVFVTIQYGELETDPVDTAGITDNTRVQEQGVLAASTSAPSGTSQILLAKVSRVGTSVNAIDLTVRALAGGVPRADQVLSRQIKEADGVSGQNTEIGSGIKTDHIQDSAITSAKILDGTITANDLANAAVATAKLADQAVTSAKIADGTISTNDLANFAVTTDKLAEGSVTGAKIADGTISTNDLGNFAVTTDKLAEGAVTTGKIADGGIISTDLANSAVTSDKIANSAVGTNALANDAVTTDKIANGAVNTNDLALGSVDINRVAGSLKPGFARAWGFVTANILAWSYNVTSMTRIAVGVYEINVVPSGTPGGGAWLLMQHNGGPINLQGQSPTKVTVQTYFAGQQPIDGSFFFLNFQP